MSLPRFISRLLASVLQPLARRKPTASKALPDTQLIKHTHTMGHGVDSEAAGWVTDYMVITNNYRITNVVGEKEEEGLRRRRSCARAARRTSCLSRLSGVSRVCRHQRVFGFDFHK